MKCRLFLFLGVLNFGLLQAQNADSLTVETPPAIDSVQLRILKVEKLEERWRSELYSNTLYDTLTNARQGFIFFRNQNF